MNINHFTYRVTWSSDDKEHVGLCAEFPSLSWLAPSPEKALSGIRKVVADVLKEMTASALAADDKVGRKLQDLALAHSKPRAERQRKQLSKLTF